ncbi:MAG: polysaccharide pyruvyl transferase CsaB [Chthonomonadaceae bacterium]|nr:polysaccharide pyruvyl transferase CsaB [Chthonomonadaceae bacterium]
MRLLLAGYFGCGNLGDDAILLGFLNGIKDSGAEVKALTANVELMMRHYGVLGVYRKDFGQVKKAIEECDALVFPGGSIFQDVTSTRSVAYYAKLVTDAKKAGKAVYLLGQGVGPLTGFLGKRLAKTAFQSADAVVLRDPGSLSTLQSIGYRGQPKVAADMAWLLPQYEIGEESTSFGVAGTKTVGISVRPWGKDKNKSVINVFSTLAQMLTQKGYIPTFIEMDKEEDGPLILDIAKTLGGKVPDIRNLSSPIQLQQRLARMECVVAMRLHAGILAATVGVPSFMVSYDPKVAAFANSIGAPAPPTMQGLTAQRLFDGMTQMIKDRERASQALCKRRDELAQLAKQNLHVLPEPICR